MRFIAALVFSVCAAFAQQTVAIFGGFPAPDTTTLTFYDGSGNPQYLCKSFSVQSPFVWAVSPIGPQGTLTSIVVATNTGTVTTTTAHGLQVGNPVTVSGSTTAALNGTYNIQTVGSTTTFTITTSGVADATYNNAAMILTTTAPRSSGNIWKIEKITYGASGPTIQQFSPGRSICDNRTTVSYQ